MRGAKTVPKILIGSEDFTKKFTLDDVTGQLWLTANDTVQVTKEEFTLSAQWEIDLWTCNATKNIKLTKTVFGKEQFDVQLTKVETTTTAAPTTTTTTVPLTTGPNVTTTITSSTSPPTTPVTTSTPKISSTLTITYVVIPDVPPHKECEKPGNGAVVIAVLEALIIIALAGFVIYRSCILPRQQGLRHGWPENTMYPPYSAERAENIDQYRAPRSTQGTPQATYTNNGANFGNGWSTAVPRADTAVTLPMTALSPTPAPISPTRARIADGPVLSSVNPSPSLVTVDIDAPNPRPTQNRPPQDPLDLNTVWNDPFHQ
ncbi:unnamed protein product, partial [Mesorhabditis spiculigera]